MRAVCPNNPNHVEFITTAHEVHDWVVDPHGEFIHDLGCSEIAAQPDRGNIWACKECGTQATFMEEDQ